VYYLKDGGRTSATVTLADRTGKAVRTVAGPAKPGINRVYINLMEDRSQAALAPGDYPVTVKIGSLMDAKTATVRAKREPRH
jgi:hypothetical protein